MFLVESVSLYLCMNGGCYIQFDLYGMNNPSGGSVCVSQITNKVAVYHEPTQYVTIRFKLVSKCDYLSSSVLNTIVIGVLPSEIQPFLFH